MISPGRFLCCSVSVSTILIVSLLVPVQFGRADSVPTPLPARMRLQSRSAPAGNSSPAGADRVQSSPRLPLAFERNDGQTDPQVKFLAKTGSATVFLTGTESVLSLSRPEEPTAEDSPSDPMERTSRPLSEPDPVTATVRMRLEGASPTALVEGESELPGKANYFIGNDPKKWRSNVPTFASVRYRDVYAGIDMVYYGGGDGLEYDFVVRPGADASDIQLAFEGADRMTVDATGNLVLATAVGELLQKAPTIYQEDGEGKRIVAGRYVFRHDRSIGFELASYDRTKPLVIDPVLVYGTYLGGTRWEGHRNDQPYIAVDSDGAAYVVALCLSTDFPTRNPVMRQKKKDFVLSKINPTGTALVYSSYIGGSKEEAGFVTVAVDSEKNVYLTGASDSTDFPTTPGCLRPTAPPVLPMTTFQYWYILAKINASGSSLGYATYLDFRNEANTSTYRTYTTPIAIAPDATGSLFIAGQTDQPTITTTDGAFQRTLKANTDAWIAKIAPDGSSFAYSTLLGGSGYDVAWGLTIDDEGNAFVAGYTTSADFPVSANAFQRTFHTAPINPPPSEAFVAKINSSGSALLYSTYLGGSKADWALSIQRDADGNAYVVGRAQSEDFPVTPGAFQTTKPGLGGNGYAAFVTKLNPTGSALVFSTYLGTPSTDTRPTYPCNLDVDREGYVYVAGLAPADFPVVNTIEGGYACPTGDCGYVCFLAKFDPAGSSLVYSIVFGLTVIAPNGTGMSVALDDDDNPIVVGCTGSNAFPTRRPIQARLAGEVDIYIAKIADSIPVDPPVIDAVTGKIKVGALAKLKIAGSNLQSGVEAFVGDDTTPWPTAKLKETTSLTLTGSDLDVRFPAGTAVRIRLHNPDGGEATTTYARP